MLPEYLEDRDWEELKRFNEAKELLYKDVMAKLGLSYCLKCLYVKPGSMMDSVQTVMEQKAPPPLQWWDDHCFYVNGFFLPDVMLHSQFAFCGFDTKYDRYWTLIQSTFKFMVKNKRYEFWEHEPLTGLAISWEALEKLCRRIRTNCAKDLNDAEYACFFEEILNGFQYIEKWIEGLETELPPPTVPVIHRSSALKRVMNRWLDLSWTANAKATSYILSRRRQTTMLHRQMVDCPEGGKKIPGRYKG